MIDAIKIKTVGVIMDGNRRWARKEGILEWKGHEAGYKKLREVVDWCREAKLTGLIVYAFSTENWNRTKDEVGYLMRLFREMISEFQKDLTRMNEEGIKIVFVGQRERFDKDIQEGMARLESATRTNKKFTFAIALSYGGRPEIVSVANTLLTEARAGKREGTVTEEEFSKYLWTHDIADPDLIIRTGGEMRLSNFLPWQGAYAELAFTETYWPAFTKKEFFSILAEVADRERRFGK